MTVVEAAVRPEALGAPLKILKGPTDGLSQLEVCQVLTDKCVLEKGVKQSRKVGEVRFLDVQETLLPAITCLYAD